MYGIIKGFSGLLNPEVPHVHLNPLFQCIPEIDPTHGGSVLGASRDYVDGNDTATIAGVAEHLAALKIDGLICVGGDGTLHGMQPLGDYLPTVLAPKTIDNDLGLNYPDEPNDWIREPSDNAKGYVYKKKPVRDFELDEMVNFVTPGYATAVYVSAGSIQRIRTTAESHRRVAIIEVMGRDCGMIALGTAYGQPDMILVTESAVDPDALVDRVVSILDVQKHAVLCVSEGVRDTEGRILGAVTATKDPAGNLQYTGAAEAVKRILVDRLGDAFFTRSAETKAPTRRSSCEKSVTRSAAAGRSFSTASRPASSVEKQSTCSRAAIIPASPRSSTATASSASTASRRICSETAGAKCTLVHFPPPSTTQNGSSPQPRASST